MNAAASFSDTATVVVTVPTQEKQSSTEEKEDYEALNRIIDSITRDFSRKGINSRLKALTRKGRVVTHLQYAITSLQSRPNTTSRHQLQRVKSRA
jgi:hypothetical protein